MGRQGNLPPSGDLQDDGPRMTVSAAVLGLHLTVRRKVREWAVRYLPAEILGSSMALAAAWAAHAVFGSLVTAAVAGTLGENFGYYGFAVVREAVTHAGRGVGRRPGWRVAVGAVRGVLIEFGPAEVVDSLVARPFLIYRMTNLIDNLVVGVIVGKLAADVLFYTLVIIAYELRKRRLQPAAQEEA
jgi:hypothetical protein